MGRLEVEEWWLTDYCLEIHAYLRQKERSRGIYHGQSPQLHLRRPLVEWLGSICQSRGLSCLVKHLAVAMMDFFMDNHIIEEERIQLVALACVLVAAKSEEKDMLIPRTSDLNCTVENLYKLRDFIVMEVALLEFFRWDLLVPTAAHFLDYYALYTISEEEGREAGQLGGERNSAFYVQRYTQYFLETALKEQSFVRCAASLVASSCVLATRLCLMINPAWSHTLQKLTGYSWTHLSSCVSKLITRLEEEEKETNGGIPSLPDTQ